jgi:hypothetical protein
MMTSARTDRSHRRATARTATAQETPLPMTRIIRATRPPRDTRQVRKAAIKIHGSGFSEL